MKYKNSPLLDSTEALLFINGMLKEHNSLTLILSKYKLYRTVNSFNVKNNKILNDMNKHYSYYKKITTLDKPLPDFFNNNQYFRIDHTTNKIIFIQ